LFGLAVIGSIERFVQHAFAADAAENQQYVAE